jgi:UPF0716 protein FxsA
MVLLAAFIAIPLIEIALFIQIGGWIGLWPTLLIVVITAIVGTVMVRSQGFSVLRRIQRSIETLEEDPTAPLAHGAMILFSGALLLTPGFFTDAVGFALLVPPVREHVFQILRRRVVTGSGSSRSRSTRDDVIDADFEEVDPDRVPPRPGEGPSPWTRR